MGGRGASSGVFNQREVEKVRKDQESGNGVNKVGSLSHADVIEKEYGKLNTKEVIVTDNKYKHVGERHPEALDELKKYKRSIVEDPNYILTDEKHADTIQLVKDLPGGKGKAVVKLSIENKPQHKGLKNSIITYQKVSEKTFNRLIKKHRILYKKQ